MQQGSCHRRNAPSPPPETRWVHETCQVTILERSLFQDLLSHRRTDLRKCAGLGQINANRGAESLLGFPHLDCISGLNVSGTLLGPAGRLCGEEGL